MEAYYYTRTFTIEINGEEVWIPILQLGSNYQVEEHISDDIEDSSDEDLDQVVEEHISDDIEDSLDEDLDQVVEAVEVVHPVAPRLQLVPLELLRVVDRKRG